MDNTNGYSKTDLSKVFRVIEEFRKIYPDMQMQTAATFVLVALQPGITIKELRERTGTVQSTCSRNVALLSEQFRPSKPGHGLVEAAADPFERRRKIVNLTPKGRRVAASLAAIVQ